LAPHEAGAEPISAPDARMPERRIIMNVRDLVPWNRNADRSRPAVPASSEHPMFTFHREMNRLFDDIFRGFDVPSLWGARGTWPQIEVEESDAEYRVSAELPGLEEKDVEVLVQDGVLILRGEKRAESEDRSRAFSERVYGRFERRVALDGIDEDRIQAKFRNGILTVTAPKSAQSRERVKRITINQATTTH
jgi:HSP20 family protein